MTVHEQSQGWMENFHPALALFSSSLFSSVKKSDRGHGHRVLRAIISALWGIDDAVDDFDARDDFAKDGVLAVEVGSVGVHEEELGPGGVGIRCSGHGEGPALVGSFTELGIDGVSRTAGPCPFGAAALNHEARNGAMENDAVVIALGDQVAKVLDVIWSDVWEEFQNDFTGCR
jgi:hypothetical protein